MDESIFLTIKAMLGYGARDQYNPEDPFDVEILAHINTYLGVLNDLGVGVVGFTVNDESATFADFLEGCPVVLNEVKSYLYFRVRQAFDNPTSGVLSEEIERQASELGYRLMTKMECKDV